MTSDKYFLFPLLFSYLIYHTYLHTTTYNANAIQPNSQCKYHRTKLSMQIPYEQTYNANSTQPILQYIYHTTKLTMQIQYIQTYNAHNILAIYYYMHTYIANNTQNNSLSINESTSKIYYSSSALCCFIMFNRYDDDLEQLMVSLSLLINSDF